MRKYRDEEPTYPKTVIDEFATITFLEDCGKNNDLIINCPPNELPVGYTNRRN